MTDKEKLLLAIDMLARLEWAGEGGHREEDGCPDCGEVPYSFPEPYNGSEHGEHELRRRHRKSCRLASVLAELGVPA